MKRTHAALAALAAGTFALVAYGGEPADTHRHPGFVSETPAKKAPLPKPEVAPLVKERVRLLIFSDKTYAYTKEDPTALAGDTSKKPYLATVASNVPLPKGQTLQSLKALRPLPIKDDGSTQNPGAYQRPVYVAAPAPMWILCDPQNLTLVDGVPVQTWALSANGCPDPRDP